MCFTQKNITKYCNAQCATFIVCVIFSFLIFIVSVLGLTGMIHFEGSYCYSTGLLGSILGLWIQAPRLKANKDDDDVSPV
jgi:hypothetical protein